MGYRIGIDFDNTLAWYDHVLRREAQRRGWVTPVLSGSKRAIREAIRAMPDGEERWQELQAYVYGPAIGQATLMPGAWRFLSTCRQRGVPFFIVSHKSEFAVRDRTGTNLRCAAKTWMSDHGFFSPDGLGLPPEAVFFEMTRQEKVQRIAQLQCSHFIDDLEETFREPTFPTAVVRLLLQPSPSSDLDERLQVFRDMDEIHDFFFSEQT